ncbi:Fur family transcriptional regulator [Syntrophomonas curvata]
MDTGTASNFLKMHNIKPSHHRIRVFQYLTERRNHPTVDLMFHDLVAEIPTLSKTTLYNTLNLFVERGIVSLITIDENESRYDADTSLHGHLQCNKCGEVYDIGLQLSSIDFADLDKFEVEESHIYFKGVCPQCLKMRGGHNKEKSEF